MEEDLEILPDKEDFNEDETVDALTLYFRRTSRGRIVDLPRWAQ